MYGLLRHYISIVEAKRGDGLSEGVKLRIASFHAARAVVDCILDAKRGTVGIIESAAALRACLKRFIERHKQAYGIQLLKPKHHWLWDIAEQWLRDHCVLDCFPIERLHLRVKGEADPVRNTRTFEKCVLAGVVIQHTLLLGKGLRGGLRGR